ncbi:hypothetical protein BDQ17DRAFT_1426785 [Cyathus striatus]|nr:hypothetical protein BDQ17DRAFT_1426785 [Cyathus striatus]
MDLLPGLSELEGGIENVTEEGLYYMGGVNNRRGMDESHSAQLNAKMNVDHPAIYKEHEFPEIEVNFTSDEDNSINRDGTW